LISEKYYRHLDIGCADGTFTRFYSEKFPDTEGYGIDHSFVSIERAKNLMPNGNFQVGNLYTLPFKDNFFDLVHCAETIEHLEKPEDAIKEMFRVLKTGGTFIITTPNETTNIDPEHLWKWNISGVKKIISGKWKLKRQFKKFFNGHILYIMGEKL
jgi:ubiquinone/menaquinone biosynthesis C-methylase UbiE